MIAVSSKEFRTRQNRRFMPVTDEVCIKREQNYKPLVEEQVILQPDEDFYRAITMDEFKERALLIVEKLDKKYANK